MHDRGANLIAYDILPEALEGSTTAAGFGPTAASNAGTRTMAAFVGVLGKAIGCRHLEAVPVSRVFDGDIPLHILIFAGRRAETVPGRRVIADAITVEASRAVRALAAAAADAGQHCAPREVAGHVIRVMHTMLRTDEK